ncbi:MAG TPA: HupE/UreJ family protein [Pseudolabrys sp.]|jgi:urease accessory protein|nr:HupE/UreJ family protein [Pseudolabrys sp.]
MKRAAVTTFVIFFVLAPAAALAHPGHDGAGGLMYGFVHPVTGIDHVLAMIAVGVLAALYGGRALWLVPLSFVAAMAMAGVIGMAGIVIPVAEVGIGLSVVVLGLAIAFQLRPPTFVAMAVVGFFALFHGYAHGAELPDGITGLSFALGFLLATALLHGTGVGLGLLMQRQASSRRLLHVGGGAMALVGIAVLANFL